MVDLKINHFRLKFTGQEEAFDIVRALHLVKIIYMLLCSKTLFLSTCRLGIGVIRC